MRGLALKTLLLRDMPELRYIAPNAIAVAGLNASLERLDMTGSGSRCTVVERGQPLHCTCAPGYGPGTRTGSNERHCKAVNCTSGVNSHGIWCGAIK